MPFQFRQRITFNIMRLRAGHRTTIRFGRCLSALAAHLLDASADHHEIISNAGSGQVSSCLVYVRPRGNAVLVVFFPFFIPNHARSSFASVHFRRNGHPDDPCRTSRVSDEGYAGGGCFGTFAQIVPAGVSKAKFMTSSSSVRHSRASARARGSTCPSGCRTERFELSRLTRVSPTTRQTMRFWVKSERG
jgi:hypothetical protein